MTPAPVRRTCCLTVSGGEGQRLKLATELSRHRTVQGGSVYVMDEPKTGLHLSDIGLMMTLTDRLVDAGNTVILIEHRLDAIWKVDWLVDLGLEGGSAVGEVLFSGPPAELSQAPRSVTGLFLLPQRAPRSG